MPIRRPFYDERIEIAIDGRALMEAGDKKKALFLLGSRMISRA